MNKTTLAEAWALVRPEAIAGNGLVSFPHIRSKVEPLGVKSHHLKKLCELGFLEVENKSRGGGRVMYRLPAALPPVERLAEEDRKPKGKKPSAGRRAASVLNLSQ